MAEWMRRASDGGFDEIAAAAAVVVPIASGSMFTKIHKGFSELTRVGLVDGGASPRMIGAQAEGCSPIVQAARAGTARSLSAEVAV